ncbi:MAG: murein biosynthesis integral membrane protein MurJ [Candidatus Methylacidiphilales bacterium]
MKRGNTTGPAVRVMVAIMGSRVLGLVRDVVLNSIFGAGAVLDAFWTAFRIPNLLRDLLAEGALSVSFTTTFSKKVARDGKEAAFGLAQAMLTSMLVLLAVVTALGMWFSPEIVAVAAKGFDPAKQELTAELTRILFPFILFVSLAAVYMGLLNTLGSFGLPASASTAFNAVSILTGLALGYWIDPTLGAESIVGFAMGTVLGGAAQLLIQMPKAASLGFKLRLNWNWKDPELRKIYLLSLPAIAGVAAVQINVLVNQFWASFMGDGSVTYFNNAFRLMQLPIGLFGVAVGMVTLPSVSTSAAEHNMQHFRWKVVEGLKLALFLTVPASLGLCFMAEPIIGLIYEHGRFEAHDTVATARLLQAFTLGLAGYACIKVLAPTFYALDMPRVPVWISVKAIGLNLLFTLILIKGFGMGLMALPLSISLVALLNLFQLALALSRKLGSITTGTDFPAFILKMSLLTLLFLVLLASIHGLIGCRISGNLFRLAYLGTGVPILAGVYFWMAWKLGFEEVDQILALLKRKTSRTALPSTIQE